MPPTGPDLDRHPPDRYTLYGFKGSGSAAVEAALERCGVPYRMVDAASWQPGTALGELDRLNPGGATPGGLDFLAAVVAKWSGTRAHLRDARPQLLATLEAIERDPVVASVFARHWPDG